MVVECQEKFQASQRNGLGYFVDHWDRELREKVMFDRAMICLVLTILNLRNL